MDHLADLKKRAAKHASWGNYWAGKVLALLDENEKLRAELNGPGALTPADRAAVTKLIESGERVDALARDLGLA